MGEQPRQVVWTRIARETLQEAVEYIAADSIDAARNVLARALDSAESLGTLGERGRMVPEYGRSDVREVFVGSYRLMYLVERERIVIVAFIHGARDFRRWLEQR
jgi:toxin ParE1/3/4